MRREDVIDLLGRIPEIDHPKLQVVLRSGLGVTADTFVRFEPFYLAMRGREAGNVEENRGFFIPYDEIICIKLERMVKVSELYAMYGQTPPVLEQPAATSAEAAAAAAPPVTPAPSAPLDPAEIAKQNLLERIRAARSMATNGAKPAAGK